MGGYSPVDHVIALIPARGGSKGVPRKNLRPLRGKPLIAYTIEQALKSAHLTGVLVSTEDAEVARISEDLGAAVIARPVDLAQDDTPTMDVVFQALDELASRGHSAGIVVLLQPTSPLRRATDIDEAIALFWEQECDSVVSVYKSPHPPHWMFEVENGYLKPILGRKALQLKRQALPATYTPNGAIFIATASGLQAHRSFYTPRSLPYIMPPERSLDIDTEFDFTLAELSLGASLEEG